MSDITFLRRRGLGKETIDGFLSCLTDLGVKADVTLNDGSKVDSNYLFRWGCTSVTGIPSDRTINTSEAIHFANDKGEARKKAYTDFGVAPFTQTHKDYNKNWVYPFNAFNGTREEKYILRPSNHFGGKDFFIVTEQSEFLEAKSRPCMKRGWYMSAFEEKEREFRIFVMQGRIVCVTEKIPEDKTKPAWNLAEGDEFRIVRWDDWTEIASTLRVAIMCHNMIGLDFSAIDVMLCGSNTFTYPLFLEANTGPAIKLIEDGKPSYRHEAISKVIKYILENGKGKIPVDQNQTGWRDYLHPALNHNAVVPVNPVNVYEDVDDFVIFDNDIDDFDDDF